MSESCFQKIKLDLPELEPVPECQPGDISCYMEAALAAMRNANKLLFISPQVVDLDVKIKALECVRQFLHQHFSMQYRAAYTPWGAVLYATKPDSQVRVPHFNPAYVIRMKEKEYDEFQTLGLIADGISRLIGALGGVPHIWAYMASLLLDTAKDMKLPIPIQIKVASWGVDVPACESAISAVRAVVDSKDLVVKSTFWQCRTADGRYTLYMHVISNQDLVDAIADFMRNNYQLTVNDPTTVVAGNLEAVVGTDVRYYVWIPMLVPEYATYVAGELIEKPGSYVIGQQVKPIQMDLATLIKNVINGSGNIAKAFIPVIGVFLTGR